MVTTDKNSWASSFLTQDDCNQIEAAVRAAEKTTSAEIVPMLVHSSVQLDIPRRILFMILLLAVMLVLSLFETHLDFYSWQGVCIELLLCSASVVIAFFAPIPVGILRCLMPKADLQLLVEQRAELEFYRLGINGTERHSGVLIFVSFVERRAVVLADKSIAGKLPSTTWDEVLATLLSGIRDRNPRSGFVNAIAQASKILAQHFPVHADDKDELANRLVLK